MYVAVSSQVLRNTSALGAAKCLNAQQLSAPFSYNNGVSRRERRRPPGLGSEGLSCGVWHDSVSRCWFQQQSTYTAGPRLRVVEPMLWRATERLSAPPIRQQACKRGGRRCKAARRGWPLVADCESSQLHRGRRQPLRSSRPHPSLIHASPHRSFAPDIDPPGALHLSELPTTIGGCLQEDPCALPAQVSRVSAGASDVR